MNIDPAVMAFGVIAVRWSAVFAALGVLAGMFVAARWARVGGYGARSVALPAAFALVVGVVSGRAAVIVDDPGVLRRGWQGVVALVEGGVSLPAAAFGGLVALGVWSLGSGRLVAMLGAAGPALLVGEAVAALGLLLNGDFVGPIVDAPWAIIYGAAAATPPTLVGRPVHPLALYVIVWNCVAFGAIWAFWRILRPSERWLFATLAFGLGHLLVGFVRLDPVTTFGLRQDQALGLVWVIVGAVGLIFFTPRRTAVAAPTRSPVVRSDPRS